MFKKANFKPNYIQILHVRMTNKKYIWQENL